MNKVKTTQVSFTITDVLLEKIDEMIAEEGIFLSRSDLVRAAIAEFFDAHRPKYIYEKSLGQKEKRKQLQESKTFESMSDEEYATSLGAVILDNRDGVKFVAFMSFNKQTIAIPLANIKKWKGTEQFEVNLAEHTRLIEEGESLEERLKTPWAIKEFDHEYNIDLIN